MWRRWTVLLQCMAHMETLSGLSGLSGHTPTQRDGGDKGRNGWSLSPPPRVISDMPCQKGCLLPSTRPATGSIFPKARSWLMAHSQPAMASQRQPLLQPKCTTHGPWPPSCLVQPCQPTALHHLDATVDSLLDGGTVTRAPAAHNTTTMVPPSHSLQKGKGGLGDRGREGSVRAKDKGLVWCVVLCLCLSSCLSFVRICRRRLPPHTHTVASSKTPPRYCGQPSTLCIPCCSSLLPPHVVCNVTFIRTPKVFVAAGRQMAGARIHGGAREKSKQTRRRAFRLSGSRCSCLSETRSVACAARRGRETMRAKAPVRSEAVVGIASWPLHMTGLSPLCPPHVMAVWRTQLQYGQYRENESEHRVCWTGHRPTLSSPP